jgi:hypothetical protein
MTDDEGTDATKAAAVGEKPDATAWSKTKEPKKAAPPPKAAEPKADKRRMKVRLGLIGAAAALYLLGFATAFAVTGNSQPAKPETQLQEIQYDMHNGNTVTCLQTVGSVVGLDCDFVNAAPAGAPAAPPPPAAPAPTSPPP